MLVAASLGLAACVGAPVKAPAPDVPVRLVLTEPWAGGGRLVIVDENGDRRCALLADPIGEEHPSFSPDGAWVVFASRRGRTDGKTSLWVAPAVPDARPRRLTDGAAHDLDPVWDPAGGAIVFASDRRGAGDLDLYRLPLVAGTARAAGPPIALTRHPGHELSPTIARGRVVFQQIEPRGRSYLAERTADGAVVALTNGPSDGSPALAPDGKRVAYAAPRVRTDGRRDLDVVVLALDEPGDPVPGIAIEATDEGSPGWSSDGRWLFATSIVRDTEGTMVLASVVHRDTHAPAAPVRMLRDRVGAIPRLGAAAAPTGLDGAALARNPDYLPALAEAVAILAKERAEREAQEAADRRRRGRK